MEPELVADLRVRCLELAKGTYVDGSRMLGNGPQVEASALTQAAQVLYDWCLGKSSCPTCHKEQ